MMKKILLFLTTLCCVAFLYAQNSEKRPLTILNEEFFIQSDLVFEGHFVRYVYTYNTTGTKKYEDNYLISAYKVQRVYKGDQSLTGGEVYIVSQRVSLGIENDDFSERPLSYSSTQILEKYGITKGINRYSPYIFFCVTSDYPDDGNARFSSIKKYRELGDDMKRPKGWGRMYAFDDKIVSEDDYLAFLKREDFYNYMKQFKGFTIPEPLPQTPPDMERKNSHEMDSLLNVMYERGKFLMDSVQNARIKENNENLKESKKKVQQDPKNDNTYSTLTLQLANKQIINSSGKKYMEFDILASSNNQNIFFSVTTLYLQYEAAIFGSYLAANGKVTVSKGPLFNHANDYIPFVYDISSALLFLNIRINDTTLNRVKVPATPTVFLHFKIELISAASGYVSFFSTSYENSYSAYTLTRNAPYATEDIYYNKTFLNSFHPQITTNLSSVSKVAGTDDVLTIQGDNFGMYPGKVYFKAADDGGQTYLKGLDAQYLVPNEWSNTQIKVIVPSMIYEGYSAIEPSGGAGSGKIKIKTVPGDSCESAAGLTVSYSAMNKKAITGGPIKRVYLAREQCRYDYQFTLHTELQNSPNMIAVIDTALRHWSERTGLKLILEKDSQGNLVFADSMSYTRNIIKFDPAYLMRVVFQTKLLDTIQYRSTGSHIYIRETPSAPWHYGISCNVPAGYYSFYHAIMHELGHVLLLGHVNDSTQLMYWQIKSTGNQTVNIAPAVSAAAKIIAASKDKIKFPNTSYVYPPGVLQAKFTITQSCYGANTGTITTVVTGGQTPYTFTWRNSVGTVIATTQNLSNLAPGNYFLELTDHHSCTLNDTISIPDVGGSNPLTLNFTKIPANPPTPELWRGNVSGGVPPYTYKWSVTSTGIASPYEKGITYCAIPEPNYMYAPQIPTSFHTSDCRLTLTVTDANGCIIKGSPPNIKEGAPMMFEDETLSETPEITVYPNPNTGTFTISNITNATVYLYTTTGMHLKTFEHVVNNETINIGNLSNGLYLLKIIDGNIIKNEKLILTH
jgi:hypothetical protein